MAPGGSNDPSGRKVKVKEHLVGGKLALGPSRWFNHGQIEIRKVIPSVKIARPAIDSGTGARPYPGIGEIFDDGVGTDTALFGNFGTGDVGAVKLLSVFFADDFTHFWLTAVGGFDQADLFKQVQ